MRYALAALVVACGAPSLPAEPAEPVEPAADPNEVHVAADATLGELLVALRASLAARGHREGDCFLAWDVEADDAITVHVGDRSRSAAVSCDGFDARALEGRCIYLRFFWVTGMQELAEGRDGATQAVTFYFAPPGRAFAGMPFGGDDIAEPASDVVFGEAPEGVRLVFAIPLRARGGSGKQSEGGPAGDNPLRDPEIAEALRQLVARMQRCNEDENGSLVFEWVVDSEGDVRDVHVITATVPEATIECASRILEEASFPAHEGGRPTDYCVPVLLDPALRPE